MPEQKSEKLETPKILEIIDQIAERVYFSNATSYVERMPPEDYDHYSKMSEISKISDENDRNNEIRKLAIKDGRDDTLRKYFDLLGDQVNDVLNDTTWLQIICKKKVLELVVAIFTYSRNIDVNLGAPNTPAPFEIACGVEVPDLIDKPQKISPHIALVKEFLKRETLDVRKCEINPLCTACSYGSILLVHLLLENANQIKLDINKESVAFSKDLEDPKVIKNSPLSIACLSSKPSSQFISKKLVERGANIYVITSLSDKNKLALNIASDEIHLLYLACINGHVDVIKKYFADTLTKTNEDILNIDTAFHYAVINNQAEVLKLLIEKGANVNAILIDKDKKATTAFHYAVINNQVEVLKLLIEKGANVHAIIFDENGKATTAFHYAVVKNQVEILKLIIGKWANVDAIFIDKDGKSSTAFQYAVINNQVEILELLIRKGANVNAIFNNKEGKPTTAFHYAVINNRVEVLKLLIQNGANVDSIFLDKDGKTTTALHYAVINNQVEVLKLLIEKGADVNAISLDKDGKTSTALHYAVINNKLDLLKLLMKNGANVNAVFLDKEGYKTTALHQACIDGNIEIVRQLLTCEAINVNAENGKELTPLFAAFLNYNDDIVKLLIDHKDVYLQGTSGTNLFLLACTRLNVEILKYSQEKRPNEFKHFINTIEEERTYLTFITYFHAHKRRPIPSKVIKIMKFLIKNGANIEGEINQEVAETPPNKVTPLMIACNFNADSIINFLIENNAGIQLSFYKTCQLDAHTANKFQIDKRKVSKMLIEKGADARSMLTIGLITKNKDVINFLIKNLSEDIALNSNEMYEIFEKEHIQFLFDIACENNYLDIVKLLLTSSDTSFPVRFKEAFNGADPLLIACQKNSTEIVDLLIKRGADVTQSFCLALQNEDLKSAELLFKHDIEVGSPFIETCKKGSEKDKKILDFLLKKVEKPIDFIRVGLFIAIEENKEEIVEHLLQHLGKNKGSSLDIRLENGMTLFCLACQKGNLIAVKKFLEHGININVTCKSENFYNFSPLHFACESKNLPIVEKLLEQEDLVLDSINSSKETPLYIALRHKQEEIAQKLIELGASKEKVLELACTKGDLEIIKTLIGIIKTPKEKLGLVNKPVDGNRRPLHVVCQNGHEEVVKFLLENHAEINSTTTTDISTPLHLACRSGHDKIAKLLIEEYNADKDQINDNGEKPVDIVAKKRGNNALKVLFGLIENAPNDSERNQHNTLLSNSIFHPDDKITKITKGNGKEEKKMEDEDQKDSPLNKVNKMEKEKEDQSNIAKITPYKIYKLYDGTFIQLPRKEVHPLTSKDTTTEIAVENYDIYYDNLESWNYPAFEEVAQKAKYYPSDATDRKCIHGLKDEIFAIKLVHTEGSDYRVLGTIIGTAVEDGKQLIYFQNTVNHKKLRELLENRSALKKTLQSPKKLKDKLIDPKTVVFEDKRANEKTVVFGNKH